MLCFRPRIFRPGFAGLPKPGRGPSEHTCQMELGYDNWYDDSMAGGYPQNGTLSPNMCLIIIIIIIIMISMFTNIIIIIIMI